MNDLAVSSAVLLSLQLLFSSPLLAQDRDSNCFFQDASGRTLDLSNLCGPGGASGSSTGVPGRLPPATRRAECQKLAEVMQKNQIRTQMIEEPRTKADREHNRRVAQKFERAAATVRQVKLVDSQIRDMQTLAALALEDGSKLALAFNFVGPEPSQNAAFGLSAIAGRMVLTYQMLADQYETYCGQPLQF